MATTDTKPGFRLPWASDRGEAEPGSAPDDATTESGDPVAEETDAAAMIDVEPATADQVETTGTADPVHADAPSATADTAADVAPAAESAPVAEAAPAETATPARAPGAKKPSKFLADLTKAMQATAESARSETMERFAAEAKAASERVHADAAEEITELRRNADDDVASIRDWSKGEISRIREETETKITARKTDLEGELEAHAGVVERRVERVSATVAAFESEMSTFFERLLAEDDPSAFASMAERIPEPPSLDGSGADDHATAPKAAASVETAPVAETAVESTAEAEAPTAEAPTADVEAAEAETAEAETHEAIAETASQIDDAAAAEAEAASEADPRLEMLGDTADFDAAEAEAALSAAEAEVATEEPGDIPAIAEEVVAARLAGLVPPSEANPEQQTARVVVTGLVSVASIAGFKRGLARTTGVGAVGVTSGPDGEFVFNVSYAADLDLKAAIAGLPGFDAKVTGESGDGFEVAARDPEARD
jgi:nicotinate-nucleotide--dimethylbenzimidazole phosphoribosyltransferase